MTTLERGKKKSAYHRGMIRMADLIMESLNPYLSDEEPKNDFDRGQKWMAEEIDNLVVLLRSKAELGHDI